jgi:hypothetical protein
LVTAHRLRVFVDAFGLIASDREELVDAVLDAEELQLEMLRGWVAQGKPVYERIWQDGGPERIAQRVAWISLHRRLLTDVIRP